MFCSFLFRPIFIPVLCGRAFGRGIDRQRLTGKLSYRIAGSIVYLTRVLLKGEGDSKDAAFVLLSWEGNLSWLINKN